MPDDVYLKVKRANKHIEELHGVLTNFRVTNPYRVGRKTDTDTGEFIYYLIEAAPVPHEIALIAGDVLQNLRSALDHLAWHLVVAANGNPSSKNSFPIMDQEPLSKDDVAFFEAKVKGMSQHAIQIIRGIKPYRGGDRVLWMLHRLNNLDKHRSLFTIGFSLGTFGADAEVIASAKPILGPLEVGGEILRTPGYADCKQMDFRFDVALNEPKVVSCIPLIAVLRMCHDRVFRVVGKFESCW